jgi:transcriptional regulator EpsA
VNPVSALAGRADERRTLSEAEQDRLVRAIQAAIEVNQQEQFHAWLCGPFRELLPHEIMVCVELPAAGDPYPIDSLSHHRPDAVAMNFLINAQNGLALHLANAFRNDRRQTCILDTDALAARVRARDARALQHGLRNAVIHRIALLSGAAYALLVFNVPDDHISRSRQLLRLVAAHLKMALSRVMPKPQSTCSGFLTLRELEILQWMGKGKSNREISAILGISTITLKNHVNKIYRKLDVQSRSDAVARGGMAGGALQRLDL